jgi:hypothetical protein
VLGRRHRLARRADDLRRDPPGAGAEPQRRRRDLQHPAGVRGDPPRLGGRRRHRARTGREVRAPDRADHPGPAPDSSTPPTTRTAPPARSSAAPLPPQASAVVDPLSVDTVLVPDTASAGADRVDPRAVGPFLLPAKERTLLRKATADSAECLGAAGIAADIVDSPSGRSRVQFVSSETDRSMELKCLTSYAVRSHPTEKKALRRTQPTGRRLPETAGPHRRETEPGPVLGPGIRVGRHGHRPIGRASHDRPHQGGGGRPAAGRQEGGRGEGGAGESGQGEGGPTTGACPRLTAASTTGP